jgi:superfamily II RNA helicase
MVFICSNEEFPNDEFYSQYFTQYNFKLSPFQKWSIKAIVDGNHSLVTAHTGSGKTLPFEFAIDYFNRINKKIIYASPLKALSNQKLYDFRKKFPHISFGILTGDIKDNPDADVLIMTTEILRNTLFNKLISGKNIVNKETINKEYIPTLSFEMDFENELGLVCFDEIHYIGDAERGSVWEQSIIMLPQKVQMLLLSATIDKSDNFAEWIESIHNNSKTVYLSGTTHRVVPLYHYSWVTMNKSQINKAKKTEYEYVINEINNNKILISQNNNVFNQLNYNKVSKVLNYIKKNQFFINRKFVLNELIRNLYNEKLLPGICFVLSRKNIEIYANEIEINLFENDEANYIPDVERECKHILFSKLSTKTANDFLLMPEYISTVNLLKKGIAIHHAGIIPIIREMIELLFEKNMIKLLFATETFAVGINMPTKTVIFTSLTKYDGNHNRYLYPHEYKQMAGRAGRRGIDTVGYVIHCNNLFDLPYDYEYKNIITGPPLMLLSKFKISYNLTLTLLRENVKESKFDKLTNLLKFTKKSLLIEDINNDITSYDNEYNKLINELKRTEECLKYLKTPENIIKEYFDKKNKIKYLTNKDKNKELRLISNIEEEYKFIKTEIQSYEEIENIKIKIKKIEENKLLSKNYMLNNIENIVDILHKYNFIDNDWNVNISGDIASNILEIHPLVFFDSMLYTNYFKKYSTSEIIAILSCFTNLTISEDIKYQRPFTNNSSIKEVLEFIIERNSIYYDEECLLKINSGSDYNIHYQIVDEMIEWCNSENEIECIKVINKIKQVHNISVGEFIKSILKINNIGLEIEKICEITGNIELLYKIKKIPQLTLKYIVTNLSLYV